MNYLYFSIIAESENGITGIAVICLVPIILIVIVVIIIISNKIMEKKMNLQTDIYRHIEEEKNKKREMETENLHNAFLNASIDIIPIIAVGGLPSVEINFKLDEGEVGFADVDIISVHNIRGSFHTDKQYNKIIITNKKFIFKGVRILSINLNSIISIEDFDISNDDMAELFYAYKITYKLRDKYNEILFVAEIGDFKCYWENKEIIKSFLSSGEVSLSVDILNEFVKYYSSDDK